jgi:peroxiredoxin-like protein
MSNVHFYEVSVKWDSARKGILSSPTLNSIEVATPPQFPGGHEGIWSPEHLFVASSAICLMTTFLAIAELSKLEFETYNSKASGKLEKVDGKFMISEIVLEPSIKIKNEKDIERAERIIHKAESNCLISNSMRTKITLNPTVSL